MHEQRAAVIRRKLAQSPFEVEVLDVGTGHRLAVNDVDDRCEAEPWRPAHVAALVGDDREEPGTYRHPWPELMELAPGAGQRFLGGILRIPFVPQHRQRE